MTEFKDESAAVASGAAVPGVDASMLGASTASDSEVANRPVLAGGLQHIALSFSGGGYRAASFTLGCAAYLNRTSYSGTPLLTRVKFISSASGGSITNLVLCSMLREGRSFEDVYKHLIERMQGCQLVDAVFGVFNDDTAWKARPDKTRNFINAFSLVYDREFFNGKTFGVLWEPPAGGKFVVEETCVNATEFNNGLNFRFGTRGVLGNQFLHFKPGSLDVVGKIKLADILACSSCFTAGFEPVVFPGDFAWQQGGDGVSKEQLSDAMVANNRFNSTVLDEKEATEEIGFMDGGIDDNQGIYAFLLADNRVKDYQYDVYFPCDVSSNYLARPFRYAPERSAPLLQRSLADWKELGRKVRTKYLLWVLVVLLVSVGLLFLPGVRLVGAVLLGMSVSALLLPMLALRFLVGRVQGAMGTLFPPPGPGEPEGMYRMVFKRHVGAFFKMPLSRLVRLLEVRGSSVGLLATTIFLKKIRRASYELLYNEKSLDVYREKVDANNKLVPPQVIEVGRLWRDHIAMTAVYQLSTKNAFQLDKDLAGEPWDHVTQTISAGGQLLDDFLLPSDVLRAVIDIATEMGTTLWFDEEDQRRKSLESLVAAGQATMCFNLLRVSYRFGNVDADWLELRGRLVADWKRFKAEPYWMYNEYLGLAGLGGMAAVGEKEDVDE